MAIRFLDDIPQKSCICFGRIRRWPAIISTVSLAERLFCAHLLGNNAGRPAVEYLVVLVFASFAKSDAT